MPRPPTPACSLWCRNTLYLTVVFLFVLVITALLILAVLRPDTKWYVFFIGTPVSVLAWFALRDARTHVGAASQASVTAQHGETRLSLTDETKQHASTRPTRETKKSA